MTLGSGDLSFSKENKETGDNGNLSWKSLADWYEDKWQDYLDSAADGGGFPEITEVEKTRVVLETGKLPYKVDSGLDAVVNFAGEQDGIDVVLSWDPVLKMQFYFYKILRDSVEIYRTYDNQIYEYTDEDPGVGTHLYEIYAYDKNEIKSEVSSVSVGVV
jgi:hypothetical protein